MTQVPAKHDGPDAGTSSWLSRAPAWAFMAYAIATSFSVYFCMYAFRKPFDAVSFNDRAFLGTAINLKTMCVSAQIIGYMISKYLGAKYCSEVTRRGRPALLVGLILVAQTGLLLFAVLPEAWKPLGMLINGLPLGMIWGLVVRYLEGRRSSEALLAGLSCSFVIAGAMTRDIGRDLVIGHWGFSAHWMPFVTGGLFLVPFVIAVFLLDRLPAPSVADVVERAPRVNMDHRQRATFLRQFAAVLVPLLIAYFFLTAYRDFRDHYSAELFQSLSLGEDRAIFSRTEKWALFASIAVMGSLNLISGHRRALAASYGVIVGGFAIVGIATLCYQSGSITGFWWMALVGVGMNLAYVPYGAILFERLMAASRFAGTSVFAIQFADGIGYSGSVLVQLWRDIFHGHADRLAFFIPFSLALSIGGVIFMIVSAIVALRQIGLTAEPSPGDLAVVVVPERGTS